LHLKVGDRLGFEIAGKFVEAPIASLRKVQWTSMQINFFVIFSPSLLADAEQTFISTLHVPHGLHPENSLIREMNNLTIVDTEAAVAQLQLVLTQLVNVVRVLSLFAVIAGLLVLGVVSASARDERLHEVALLRALGATRATLSVALWTETAFVGSLSGMLAAMSANILANLLGAFMFDLPWAWRPASFAVAILAAVVLAWLGGWWGTRQVTRQSPLLSLREI
jgi:putative ABC transport system permease protein